MVAQRLVYKGLYRQRGHGIGNLVGQLFRHIVPSLASGVKTLVKSKGVRRTAKAAAKSVLQTGIKAISDASKGKPVQKGLSSNLRRAKKRIAEAALGENVQCRAKAPKRMKKSKRSNAVKRKHMANNIFS